MPKKCDWCLSSQLYQDYHDNEWGVPVHDEQKHFEFLLLETMQAGLSWITILKRRENYRNAFCGFDPKLVAKLNKNDIDRLMQDTGIIRNYKKIESAVNNAKCFLDIQKEFGSFNSYIWGFTQGKIIKNSPKTMDDLKPKSELSDIVSKDLKKRGFKFVGSTTIYAHLQAIGVINDHLVDCFRYNQV